MPLPSATNAKDDDEDDKKGGPIARLMQRRIDRVRKLLDILQDREKSLSGAARDAVKDRVQEVRDRLSKLLGRDKKDKDDDEKAIKDDDDEDDKKESFVTRRINRLRESIKNIEKRLKLDTLSDKAREIINLRIDVLRSLVDRLLKREQKEKL